MSKPNFTIVGGGALFAAMFALLLSLLTTPVAFAQDFIFTIYVDGVSGPPVTIRSHM
ncbi:MAG: hypothetical protein ETSY2_26045 [Candidatus Entotheonella gemina]|uniref:Uncharacterized protein n=1 Tax=Candidatus Entotheonella gemina TaxID=1429439 RepID=W4M3K3_9BACT|nr:MAG: hypothetical protein ETSY2_26045 [Candidatus Entotheonella gemina]